MQRLINKKFPQEAQEIRKEVSDLRNKKNKRTPPKYNKMKPKTTGGRMMAFVTKPPVKKHVRKVIKKKPSPKKKIVKKTVKPSSSGTSRKKIRSRNKA
jgi:hypothetical protein